MIRVRDPPQRGMQLHEDVLGKLLRIRALASQSRRHAVYARLAFRHEILERRTFIGTSPLQQLRKITRLPTR